MLDDPVIEIELRWADGFGPLRPTYEMYRRDAVVALWSCPVCSSPTHRRRRPGRPRVYCSNACRQKAYRWRCRHRSDLRVERPIERAATRDRIHAVRPLGDPVGARRNSAGRGVTACGAFARVAADQPDRHSHTKLIPGESTCRSCRRLLGLRPVTRAEAFERVERYVGRSLRARSDLRPFGDPRPGVRELPSDSADRRAP